MYHIMALEAFSTYFVVLFYFLSSSDKGKIIATTINTSGSGYNWNELDLGNIDELENYFST